MLRATTAYEIVSGSPKKLEVISIDLEKSLEDWIEKDPELLEPRLAVIARQLETDGGTLDLLCLDESGRLVVVEVKRGDAYRDALAQVLDYAACIAALDYEALERMVNENRKKRGLEGKLEDRLKELLGNEAAAEWTPDAADTRIMLAGAGADASLRRIVDHLTARYAVPVNGVFLDVSKTQSGSIILVRSAVVADDETAQRGRTRGRGGITTSELLGDADKNGVRGFVEPVLAALESSTGQTARPERKGRCWTVASRNDGRVVVAWLYPYTDNEPDAKKAWLKIHPAKLATDLGVNESAIQKSLAAVGISLSGDSEIELSSPAGASTAAKWMTDLYATAHK